MYIIYNYYFNLCQYILFVLQVIINLFLIDGDEYMVFNVVFYQIRIVIGMVYGMRIFSEIEGFKFLVIIQNILRFLKGRQCFKFNEEVQAY